ncbi:MAG: hypothetical protein WDA09_04530 [Bacteriovoracaceae bacterium]
MSQTILIETNQDLKKLFSLNLQTFVGTDIIHRENAEDTIALLKILPQISLIITRVSVDDEETAKVIFNYLRREELNIPLIVLGACPDIAHEVLCLEDPISWEIVIKEAAKKLGVVLDTTKKIKSEYVPVSLHYFYEINRTPCDVFIRIKKGRDEYQFVKRIHQKDTFDKEDILKYEKQGLKEFYISTEYIQYFTNFVTNELVSKLEDVDLSLEERILTTSYAHEIVRERLQQLEIDQACIELSETSINSMVKSVRNSPEVVNLLKFLFSNKVSYAYQQAHLLALICHYILSKQSWYKHEHLSILSFVSFFADATLKTVPQMRISSLEELDKADLSEEEKEQVMYHARDAVNILSIHPEATEYIKTVLLQSHGTLNGVGFNEDPPEELHPLSKVFIIADHFVKILLNPELPSTKKEILSLMSKRYSGNSYQKIMKALEQKFV